MLAEHRLAAAESRPRAFCKGCRRRRKVNRLNGCCSQCDTSLTRTDDSPRDLSSSPQSSSPVSPTTPTSFIRSRAADRTQLLSQFLEAHFPVATRLEADMHRRSSFMAHLPGIDLSSPLLSSAVTSLCLAYFGSRDHSSSLVHASQNAYGDALATLVRVLPSSSKRSTQDHRDVIASILLLSLYDECTPAHQRNNSTWVTHFWGALQYLESLGPSCINLDELFEAKMFTNLRFPAIILSFARRQGSLFDRPEWRSPRGKHIEGSGPNNWFPLLTPLGRLLHRADEMLSGVGAAAAGQLLTLYNDFSTFRDSLLLYINREFHPAEGAPGVGTIVGVDPTAFNLAIEEHCFLTTSTTFPTHHHFLGGPRQVYRCTVSWFALLIADCTVLRLLLRYPMVKTDRSFQDTEAQAYSYATNLCRSVFEVSKLSSLAYAYFSEVFLRLACSFFEDNGAFQEMSWVQTCMVATQLRTSRLESTSSPTLCRIRDLGAEFTEAGRYRARNVSYQT